MAQSLLNESLRARPAELPLAGSPARLSSIPDRNLYSLAQAFLHGEFDVDGDLVDAVREVAARHARNLKDRLASALFLIRAEAFFQTRSRAAANIRFHYDRSDEFYRQFLDSRLVYSCAYFVDPAWTLERAQLEKLDYICRKLDLTAGKRFLDIGCGWGALALHAAERYGAIAYGCTLSRRQLQYARQLAEAHGLASRVVIRERDYRDLSGTFDRIASIGMFEHVGRRRLRGYFEKAAELLSPGGLFLNHGIVRPQTVKPDLGTLLWQRRMWPGAELVHLSDVCREAERAGFEVLDVENLRLHYALTCRAWVDGLRRNEAECLRHVDRETHRTWLLVLAGAAASFEDGRTDVCQVLLARRDHPRPRRMSRDYMYAQPPRSEPVV